MMKKIFGKCTVFTLVLVLLFAMLPVTSIVAKADDKSIGTVDVGDINALGEGKVSEYFDMTGTMDEGFTVENESNYWSDEKGTKLGANDSFKKGEKYLYTFSLKAKDGYVFSSDVRLTILGDAGNVESGMTKELSSDKKTVTFKNAYSTVCGGEFKPTAITTVKIVSSGYTYNGKVQKPSEKEIKVYDQNNNLITDPYAYKLVYGTSSSKLPGTYTVRAIAHSYPYEGEAQASYTIMPKGTSITKISSAKKKLTVKWKKQKTQTSGYEIQLATDKKFTKNLKTVTIKNTKTTKKTIKKLKAKKKYFVRIRSYKTVKGRKVYSKWSKVKTKKTK